MCPAAEVCEYIPHHTLLSPHNPCCHTPPTKRSHYIHTSHLQPHSLPPPHSTLSFLKILTRLVCVRCGGAAPASPPCNYPTITTLHIHKPHAPPTYSATHHTNPTNPANILYHTLPSPHATTTRIRSPTPPPITCIPASTGVLCNTEHHHSWCPGLQPCLSLYRVSIRPQLCFAPQNPPNIPFSV